MTAMLMVPLGLRCQTVAGRLDFSDSIRMVDCDPAATAPCFRLKFNIVDSNGAPLPAQLPPPEKLAENISVRVDSQAITPFFATASADTKLVRGRVALILVDISGSMNRKLATGETRFEAAKAAISSFLDGFENGTDRVAIVPFESHHVEPAIRAAWFAGTKEEALKQVQALPVPQPHNNTALYSAISIGLDVLSAELKHLAAGTVSPESMLMVMTDGTNEILKGDDAGLLTGPVGLQQAAAKVQASGFQVMGVGFGDPKEIDEAALRQVSTKYNMASDAAGLARIFSFARTLLSSRLQATFASPWPDRASLAGKTLHVSVQLKLATGNQLSSDQKIWATPQIGVPLFEGRCDLDEMRALVQKVTPSSSSGWMSVLRPVLVFLGLGTLLLVMWFWIPRLVWPEQFVGVVPTRRWANQTGSQKVVKTAPPGFEAGTTGAQAPRAPLDATVVIPRPDMTKTRLEPRPGGKRGRD
jgi:hypothetical protein